MRATALRREAARLVGVDVRSMVTLSFALAAALGALAGLVVAPLTQTAFDVGAGTASRASRRRSSAVSQPDRGGCRRTRAGSSSRSPRLSESDLQGRGALIVLLVVLLCARTGCSAVLGGRRRDGRAHMAQARRSSLRVRRRGSAHAHDRPVLLRCSTFVGLNVLVVVGLALLFGYSGQVSLGNAAFVGIGAYTCATLTADSSSHGCSDSRHAGAVAARRRLLLALPSLRLRGHYLPMATLARRNSRSFSS